MAAPNLIVSLNIDTHLRLGQLQRVTEVVRDLHIWLGGIHCKVATITTPREGASTRSLVCRTKHKGVAGESASGKSEKKNA